MLPRTNFSKFSENILKNSYTYKLSSNNKEFREDFSVKMFVKKNFQRGFSEGI